MQPTIWNNCLLFYTEQEIVDLAILKDLEVPLEVLVYGLEKYVTAIQKEPKENIWFDTRSHLCFGSEKNWYNSKSIESSFISDRGSFLSGPRWGRDYVKERFGSVLGEKTVENQEIIYQDLEELKKYKDSKILIVGGGPTTNSVDWNANDYDYVWSCNHFFLNEKMQEMDVSLMRVGAEVDLSHENEKLHDYLKSNSTVCCFEDNNDTPQETMKKMSEEYPDRIFYSHTRYRAKIGVIPRLLCTAVIMGAKEISVVGMDGLAPTERPGQISNHSFEKDKPHTGTIDYDLYRQHYVMLWDYLLNDLKEYDVEFQNLGEGHPSNQTTDISKQTFHKNKRTNEKD